MSRVVEETGRRPRGRETLRNPAGDHTDPPLDGTCSVAAAGQTAVCTPTPRCQSPGCGSLRRVRPAGCQRTGLGPWRVPSLLREKAANAEVDCDQTPAPEPVSLPLPCARPASNPPFWAAPGWIHPPHLKELEPEPRSAVLTGERRDLRPRKEARLAALETGAGSTGSGRPQGDPSASLKTQPLLLACVSGP